MTKRRASIHGRGTESTFGGLSTAYPEAEEADAAAPTRTVAALQGDLLDEELERVLYEEARHGAPLPAGAPAQVLPWEDAVLASPEVEAAMIEEAFAAEDTPERQAGASAPGSQTEDAALAGSSPAESGSGSVLPPRSHQPAPDLYQDAPSARDIQQPETGVQPIELPTRELSEEQRQAILSWWGDGRIQELSAQIDAAYEAVRLQVGDNEAITTEAYNQLLKARDILIRRDAGRIAQAEYYIEQVQVRLKRAAASEAAAKKAQWPLMFWGMLWGAAFLAALILVGMDLFQEFLPLTSDADSLVQLDLLLSAMLWGGIGGAVAVLYSLFKHVGKRDFDKHYAISYVGKPFLGLIVGATAYMIVALVVRALGIMPTSQTVGDLEPAPAIAPGVIYLVAWAAGFKEDRLLALVDRLMKQVFGSSQKKDESASSAGGPAG
jgi:hypothetical protein